MRKHLTNLAAFLVATAIVGGVVRLVRARKSSGLPA